MLPLEQAFRQVSATSLVSSPELEKAYCCTYFSLLKAQAWQRFMTCSNDFQQGKNEPSEIHADKIGQYEAV